MSYKRAKKDTDSTAGWTPGFMETLLRDVEAQKDPLDICKEHEISLVQFNKFLVRVQHMKNRTKTRVNIEECLEDYRHAVMKRLPELAATLPDDVKTAEFLRKSAVDLGNIGQNKEKDKGDTHYHQTLIIQNLQAGRERVANARLVSDGK